MKRLIINADDFGWSRGITDGVLCAHLEGVVSSATLMVNQPASEYALEQAQRTPRLGVGIHLHLCDGAPVLPAQEVPALVSGDGRFYPIHDLTRRLWRGRIPSAQIEAEFLAQIRWMKERGRTPTHADSHHHIHFHPRAAGAFRRALLAEGIGRARPPRRVYGTPNGSQNGARAGTFYRRWCVQLYLASLHRTMFRKMCHPDRRLMIPFRDGDGLERLGEAWRLALSCMPPGTYEVECHPGIFEAGFSEADHWSQRREAELRILTDPALRLLVEQNDLQLLNYTQLNAPFQEEAMGEWRRSSITSRRRMP